MAAVASSGSGARRDEVELSLEGQEAGLLGGGREAAPPELLEREASFAGARWRSPAVVGLGLAACLAVLGLAVLRHPSAVTWSRIASGDFTQLQVLGAGGAAVRMVQTAQNVGKLQWQPDRFMVDDFPFAGPVVDVNPYAVDQELLGFGGAFTESSAVIFKQLTPNLQEQLLEQYFGDSGLGYTMGRVHINSCDFSMASYSFDDTPGDFGLTYFDTLVKHDAAALIPFMERAKKTVEKAGQGLRILATPWSPPAWMKVNGKMDKSSDPCLREESRPAWAMYIAKWITAYKARQIPIWALTIQNEPEANSAWEACLFSPEQEADFLANFLGPTLKREHPDVDIFVHDHNKDHVYNFASTNLRHPTAKKYVHGVAFHWYAGDRFDSVARVHKEFPKAVLLASEATYEKYRWGNGNTKPYWDWSFGEGYAHDIIGDLNAGASGWIDWNLILDTSGGPNHVNNVCDAAIVADVEAQTLTLHPQYYYIGHFSKFIPSGSKRLITRVRNSPTYVGPVRPYGTCTGQDGLEATAFFRPDQQVATVVLNCGDKWINFKLRSGGHAVNATIPPHGIQTYLFDYTLGL